MKHDCRTGVLGLAALLLLGQGPAEAAAARDPGSWSLQFRIAEDFTLTRFDGASIALKRHFSATTAVRAGIGVGSSSLSVNDVSTDGSGSQVVKDREDDGTTVDLTVLLVRHRTPERRVSFVWGMGPTASYRGNEATIMDTFPDGSMSRGRTERTTWVAGLRGIAGVECTTVDWLAVHAEYALEATHRWTDSDVTATPPTGPPAVSTQEQREWAVGSGAVLFGASVYF
jgi:hypothetical protein